ncbi:hypothetical protein IE53DRAFT_369334 [Violaceomyces palustris]|uniref:Uncharacterized protein n=1 Tax=Violaceomyces palustris TaxID=1673888 RepID=A0ACD0NVW3_9BASI|nr:hypothetical protein IE53DRAFT_369334 [Violaceomyces palustris]
MPVEPKRDTAPLLSSRFPSGFDPSPDSPTGPTVDEKRGFTVVKSTDGVIVNEPPPENEPPIAAIAATEGSSSASATAQNATEYFSIHLSTLLVAVGRKAGWAICLFWFVIGPNSSPSSPRSSVGFTKGQCLRHTSSLQVVLWRPFHLGCSWGRQVLEEDPRHTGRAFYHFDQELLSPPTFAASISSQETYHIVGTNALNNPKASGQSPELASFGGGEVGGPMSLNV